MRVMEDQQKRHIKDVCMDFALRSLASEHGSDNSVSGFSSKSAHTQNTATERINSMLTGSINARKAEYFDLFGYDMEPPHELDSSSSSDGPNYSRNHIHIEDHFNSMGDLKKDSMLREMGSERRSQEINDNNAKMFQEELSKIHGDHDMQNMQTQQVVNDLLRQIQTQVPPPYASSDNKPKPLFLQDPIVQQHLRSVGMSQQPRKPNAASSSSNNDPESTQELKGTVGRPRNHGVPTETQKIPFIGKLNQPNSLEHNYQIEDGGHLIFNQSRQAPTSASNNDPESPHEPKGPVGRPRNTHGVPTETRKYPFYWQSQPTGFIRTQLSNRGWGTPHFQHLIHKGAIAKRLTKEHYLKELFHLLGDIGY